MNISDQDWKIILALAGTVTGWLLAQGASTAKFFWRRRWLRKHLLIELEDVQAELGLTLLQYEGLIKIAAIGGIYPQSRVPVETPIYRAFFTEAYATLNRAQRVSYKTTHSAIQSVNAGFDTLRDFLHELDAKNLSKEQLNVRVEDWMGLLKAQYLNASFAYAHVYFHLSNRKRPELGDPYGSVAQWFGEQDHKAADRIKTFIEFAKGKTVSELKVHMAERTV